jgi:hypothetical protein
MIETGTDLKLHFEFFGEFDRARLHDLGAEAGQFQHFVVGNLVDLLRVRHEARVGGVDAVDVGVNFAGVGLERGGHGDGGEVGAAATERGDVAVVVLALEAGDDDDMARSRGARKLFSA